MSLPWEYLFDDHDFLATSQSTPVVRYLDLVNTRSPLELKLPLRILGMVSAPTDAATLDVAKEKSLLTEALNERGLINKGLVEIHWLPKRTCDHSSASFKTTPTTSFTTSAMAATTTRRARAFYCSRTTTVEASAWRVIGSG